jgi:hypothetical protein
VSSCWGWIGVAVALLATAGAGRARAEAIEPPATFPVELEGSEPGISVGISGRDSDIPCGAACTVDLAPGEYTLRATRPDGRASVRKVLIRQPVRITVEPHNHAARVTGIVMMPIGVAALGGGLLAASWVSLWSLRRDCRLDCADTPRWVFPAAGVAMAAGAVLVGTGLALWKLNTEAGITVNQISRGPRRDAGLQRLQLTPAVGPQWAGLALGGRF